jgi:Histidine kinase-, DNA gyrase B-, and HSP90-like ATPase
MNSDSAGPEGVPNGLVTQEDAGGQQTFLPTFGDNFLVAHAGTIITDPKYAIIELVANAWDAGATEVRIDWPQEVGQELAVADNGIGMTRRDFLKRWKELNYNRVDDQGLWVEFPPDHPQRRRAAFGRNGVGRHAMFCFADTYHVDSAKDGAEIRAKVTRSHGTTPFIIDVEAEQPSARHGTRLYTTVQHNLLDERALIELIGSRFVADPEFRIFVNDNEIHLTDLEHLSVIHNLQVDDVGTLIIRRYDSQITGRTSKQNGVAWWVNRRLVGVPSWDVWDGALLDSRTAIAKRLVYVVEADPLTKAVKQDWSGFHASQAVNRSRRKVAEFVQSDLRNFLHDIRRERKRQALITNQRAIRELPLVSQEQVARFVEEIQEQSPTLGTRDLESMVQVLARLEQARSGYSLLARLAQLEPNEMDVLDEILETWSIADAKKVLDELHYRLKLIENLEQLVERESTDELHDLQPLFERGLWIFGPRFESISFTSNRALATVVKTYFGSASLEHPRNRPDFVALPDSSIGLYSSDSYDEENEVDGLGAVVIVELKRGGSEITTEEKDQALGYTRELRKSGKVTRATKVTAYVLGTHVTSEAQDTSTEGNITIYARTYSTILRQAHARTFDLLKKIKEFKNITVSDDELAEVLDPSQYDLLSGDNARAT